jgi:hypothetical protein
MAAWVTTDRHRFLQRIVKIGLQKDGRYQVLEGLQRGELAVTDGAVFPQQHAATARRATKEERPNQRPSCSNLSLHSASAAARLWCSPCWLFAGAGFVAFKKLNIEAYPNPTPVILEITAQAPGLSAEEMERYYTIPMEIGLYTTPGIEVIRSTSFYGLSFVRVVFKYGVDYHFAYAQAAIALQQNVTLPGNQIPQSSRTARPGRSIATGGRAEAFWADQSAHGSGLDRARRLLDHSRHRANQQLGRHHQGIRGRGGPAQAGSLQRHRAANPDRPGQRQHQRRRARNPHRPAVHQHPRRRLD